MYVNILLLKNNLFFSIDIINNDIENSKTIIKYLFPETCFYLGNLISFRFQCLYPKYIKLCFQILNFKM